MSNIGIGLGAFVQGFNQSRNARQERSDKERLWKEREEDRRRVYARQDQQDAWAREDRTTEAEDRSRLYSRQDEQDARAREDRAFTVGERKRAVDNRAALEGIEADTQADFKKAVAAGEANASDFDDFWLNHALPRRRLELMKQGDTEGAKSLMEWGRSESTLKANRMFNQALVAANQGDAAGALKLAIGASQVQGYMDHGMELIGQDELQDKAGNVLGYRIRYKDADGKEGMTDIRASDVPRVIATYANPYEAFKSKQEVAAAAAKKQDDLDNYRTKKLIDKEVGADSAKKKAPQDRYKDAVESRRKNDLDFEGLSPEQQDAVVRADLAREDAYASTPTTESSTPPAAKPVMVDNATGEIVQPAPRRPQLRTPAQGTAVDRQAAAMVARPGGQTTVSGGAVQAAIAPPALAEPAPPPARAAPVAAAPARGVAPGLALPVAPPTAKAAPASRPVRQVGSEPKPATSATETPRAAPTPTQNPRTAAIRQAVSMVREKRPAQEIASVLLDFDVSRDEFMEAVKADRSAATSK